MLKTRREKKFIENESFKDTLTNVYNRKKLESIKPILEDKAMRKELVTYVVDLDKLKPINDTFGHDVGDKFIIYAAEILKEVFGKNGYIFRIGGDEFYIVTFLDLNKIKEDINELNDKLDHLIQKKRREIDKPFNLSYGYAVKRSFENIDQAFKRADKKMYKNKQNNKIDR
jgi:diguanylate cyclase (GGDEF)-like protein